MVEIKGGSQSQTPGRERAAFGSFKLNPEKIVTISPEATLREAAELMRSRHLGDVLVCRNKGEYPVGIITDRDLAIRVLAVGGGFDRLKVQDVMSSSIVCARETDDVFAIVGLMKKNGVSRLPVIGKNDQVVGIVTARNVIRVLAETLEDITRISEKQQSREQELQH